MAKPEADPRQGLLFESEAVVSRLSTAPGDDTGTKRKKARRKDPAELIGTTRWKPYTGKTRVQCSACVLAAKASWEAGRQTMEYSIGAARWIEITYLAVHQAGQAKRAVEQHAFLCPMHADERGHTHAKKGRS